MITAEEKINATPLTRYSSEKLAKSSSSPQQSENQTCSRHISSVFLNSIQSDNTKKVLATDP